ncbi:MAG: TraR/DksA C4-type zinc finger protein [Candidatus Kerfeldbacteria bacterium]
MDQAFIDGQKKKLLEEKEMLNEGLDFVSTEDKGDHVPGDRAAKFPNYGDDALNADDQSPAEVVDYEVNVNVTGRLESRDEAVDAALKRTEDGSYGVCGKCGGEVSAERLEADPAAAQCITCAKSHV